MGEERNACRIVVGKPGGKETIKKTRRKWKDKTKMDLRKIKWSGMEWINVARDRDQ
jgi:hypothetical protein